MADPFRVCMVCTGNICRSPMAEIVLRRLAEDAGLADELAVTSAGTGEWHVGESADPRTVTALEKAGYDGSAHRARQFEAGWFDELDLVVALDRSHERILRSWARSDDDRAKIRLLLSFDQDARGASDVADPYYGDAAMFDTVLAEIERADRALFHQLAPALRAVHTAPIPLPDPAARKAVGPTS